MSQLDLLTKCDCGRGCVAVVRLAGGESMCLGTWLEITGGRGAAADAKRLEWGAKQKKLQDEKQRRRRRPEAN